MKMQLVAVYVELRRRGVCDDGSLIVITGPQTLLKDFQHAAKVFLNLIYSVHVGQIHSQSRGNLAA